MLAYLAVRGEARRDELVELLWGEVPEAKARNAFRQALHRLRGALGEEVVPQDRERVLLNRGSFAVDRDAFLGAVNGGRPGDAVAAYPGDFLEGFELGEPSFDQWADGERTHLRGLYERALRDAGRAAFEAGQWNQAIEIAQRLVAASPFDEEAALLEAGIHVAAGRAPEGAGALRRFIERIRTELDLPAPPRARDMLARIDKSESRGGWTTPATGGTAQREVGAGEGSIPLVGREIELTRIVALVQGLRNERGAAALVVGDAGVGKSRVLEEAVRRARAFGPLLVLRGRERASGGVVPYASVAEALRGALRASGISGASQHLLAEAARLLPELRDEFELPAVSPVNDEASRVRFFEGIAALIDAIAYERPVVLALDDLHNASSSTIDLLQYLIARLQSSPVLFLLAARADTAAAARLPESGDVLVHALGPLSPSETAALLGALVPSELAREGEVERVAALAGGHPMRVIELARRMSSGESPSAVPAHIRDMLWGRLVGCSPSRRRVFFAAALLQHSVPLPLLAAAAHLPEGATFDAVSALESLGLLAQDETGFSIAHDSTESFVLELSGPAGRALLAGWAAEALLHHGGEHAELAHLYAMAGRHQPAFSHSRLAALAAAAAGAISEAHRLLLQAITFAPDQDARAEVERLLVALGHGRGALAALRATIDESPDESPDEETAFEDVPSDAAPRDTSSSPAAIDVSAATSRAPAPPEPSAPASPPRLDRHRARRAMWLGASALAIAAVLVATVRAGAIREDARVLTDSLLVTPQGRGMSAEVVTGVSPREPIRPRGEVAHQQQPAWADSVAIPWVNARPSPDGRYVALERMTPLGTDLYLVSANRRDTLPVALGGGDDVALGWAPDSRALLVSRARTLGDGSYDADLFAFRLAAPGMLSPIDTVSRRTVSEAAWSPDGTQIAWASRIGTERQQDVFVGLADGSEIRNVTHNPAEDYHLAWSPDGALVGFTSERDGNAELYALELATGHLWRLTSNPAHDDRAAFAPDGKHVAFESTRSGKTAVYLMAALGGAPRRATPDGQPYALVGWRGRTIPFLDRLRVIGGSRVRVGDTLSVGGIGLDQHGNPFPSRVVRWSFPDSASLRPIASGSHDSLAVGGRVVGMREGFARVVATVPGWRADTLVVRVGAGSVTVLADDFTRPLDVSRWQPLGTPMPVVRTLATGEPALAPNGDLEWESGVLSRDNLPLRAGLRVEARFFVPFEARALPASSLQLALVPSPGSALDQVAPQFVPRIAIVWNGESGRMTYVVERETSSESTARLGAATGHSVRIAVEADGRVAFYVDERLRWRSTLRVTGDAVDERSRLWIGGRATGSWGAVGKVRVSVND
jgi:DNA-binding SARP family transcriptional activator